MPGWLGFKLMLGRPWRIPVKMRSIPVKIWRMAIRRKLLNIKGFFLGLGVCRVAPVEPWGGAAQRNHLGCVLGNLVAYPSGFKVCVQPAWDCIFSWPEVLNFSWDAFFATSVPFCWEEAADSFFVEDVFSDLACADARVTSVDVKITVVNLSIMWNPCKVNNPYANKLD